MDSPGTDRTGSGSVDRPRTSSTSLLVKLAHGSAPFISTFLLIHLSAPVLANLGGSSLSSNVMLLGREYYQTPFGERYLLLTPLTIHVASALARRLFASPSQQPRKLSSPLTIAAYAALVFVPIHFYTHRVAPTDPSPPIFSVGPSELDYEFVKTGLTQFPWRSWLLYAGLVGSVLVHAVEGVNVLRTTWAGEKPLALRTRRIVAGTVVLPVLVGVWTLSREPLMALSSTVKRYGACLMKMWVYRI